MTRSAWIGGGALMFVGLVFAMVPPTKPLGGAKIDPNAHHGPAVLPAPRAQPTPAVAAMPPAGFSGPAAAVASAANDAWPWRPASDDDAPAVDAPLPQARIAPPAPRLAPARGYSAPSRSDPRYAYRDPEPQPASADEDRAFRAGYRWAQQRDIDDPRACRGLDYGPGADGCAAYARAARNRYDRDDRFALHDRYGRQDRYARSDEDDDAWR